MAFPDWPDRVKDLRDVDIWPPLTGGEKLVWTGNYWRPQAPPESVSLSVQGGNVPFPHEVTKRVPFNSWDARLTNGDWAFTPGANAQVVVPVTGIYDVSAYGYWSWDGYGGVRQLAIEAPLAGAPYNRFPVQVHSHGTSGTTTQVTARAYWLAGEVVYVTGWTQTAAGLTTTLSGVGPWASLNIRRVV